MYAATSDAEGLAWFVAKAAMSVGLRAGGRRDTRPWVSLTLAKQSGLCNAQHLFTGKEWAGGPKDKFNSVLNLIVVMTGPQTSHFSWEPLHQSQGECPRDGGPAPRGSQASRYTGGTAVQTEGWAPSPTGKALCKEWVMLVPKKKTKTKLLTGAPIPDPRLRGQVRFPGACGTGQAARSRLLPHAGEWRSITGKRLVLLTESPPPEILSMKVLTGNGAWS